jgi:hypothetical protein
VNIGQSFKMSKTSTKLSKQRSAPSKAPTQKSFAIKPISYKENHMNSNHFSIAIKSEGKLSFSKTLGPWALAVACSVTTGGQFHYAQPYASL